MLNFITNYSILQVHCRQVLDRDKREVCISASMAAVKTALNIDYIFFFNLNLVVSPINWDRFQWIKSNLYEQQTVKYL